MIEILGQGTVSDDYQGSIEMSAVDGGWGSIRRWHACGLRRQWPQAEEPVDPDTGDWIATNTGGGNVSTRRRCWPRN